MQTNMCIRCLLITVLHKRYALCTLLHWCPVTYDYLDCWFPHLNCDDGWNSLKSLITVKLKNRNIRSSVWFTETRHRTVLLECDTFVCLLFFFLFFCFCFRRSIFELGEKYLSLQNVSIVKSFSTKPNWFYINYTVLLLMLLLSWNYTKTKFTILCCEFTSI